MSKETFISNALFKQMHILIYMYLHENVIEIEVQFRGGGG